MKGTKEFENKEQRATERHGIQVDGREHLFKLKSQQGSFPITDIQDVSVSGMGLEASTAFNKGTGVMLNYSEGDFDMDIQATIIWCNPLSDENKFALGIEFDAANGGNNSLFFLAMRKYLDEFDGVTMDA